LQIIFSSLYKLKAVSYKLMHDLAIIGGGPAGVAGGVYAARKRLKTVFITEHFGGQSIVSFDIQNWIGTTSISGEQFAKKLEEHLRTYAGPSLSILTGKRVDKVLAAQIGFSIAIKNGETVEARAVLVTTGSTRRKLAVPGAAEFENKGITYCASCDGPLFADMDVAVVGGGNAAFETAAQLLAYAKSVTLLTHGDFRADPVTVEKVFADPKMKALSNVELLSIEGEKFVTSLTYRDKATQKTAELPVQGVFVEIGLIPSTDLVKDLVSLNEYNQIVVDHRNQRTSRVGIWAAGDCTNAMYHQNNIAAGDAVRALEDIYMYLRAGKQ